MGCGAGRHAFELYRRGAHVVAFDRDESELAAVATMFGAMELEGEVPPGASAKTITGDALNLPFPDDSFSKIVAAEVLEHIPDDMAAMRELLRVLKPGGRLAVTVPSWLPERICWALSEDYHTAPGGHVRIYTRAELEAKLKATGFRVEATTTPTACTRRTGGSNARSASTRTTTRWPRRTTRSWCGTS